MTKAEFVTRFSELLTDLSAIRGFIVLEATSHCGSDWDAARTKQGAQLAAYFWDRFDQETNEYLLVRIREYVNDAISCIEAQENPLTRDPANAYCRPIVTIDEHGSPTCDWKR
jgi:hypothetical protein